MEKQKKEIKEEKKPTFSMGAKKPKKEINIELRPKHLVLGFLILMGFVLIIMMVLVSFGVFEVEGMKISCTHGGYEDVLENKTFYCGVHYTELEGIVSEESYTNMENIILGVIENE